MTGLDLHYPITGFIFLAGAVVFLKGFDFFAAQSVKRLLDMAGDRKDEECPLSADVCDS